MLYVELDNAGVTRHLHYAPYLDYRPLADDEPVVDAFLERPESAWIDRDLEQTAQAYAVADVVPEHLAEVRAARLALIDKTAAAVKDRLTKEISYWDHRAAQLALEEGTGKTAARLNPMLQAKVTVPPCPLSAPRASLAVRQEAVDGVEMCKACGMLQLTSSSFRTVGRATSRRTR